MLITAITTEECREILTRTGFGHLACSRDNEPYVIPIYFAYEPDHLYGFSTFGQKIEWMRANPRVCVAVDEVADQFNWASVIVKGQYKELPGTQEHNSERQHAFELLEKRKLWWQTAEAAREFRSAKPFPSIFYYIYIEAMSGRRATPGNF
jgi:nitroimidazol reductase NimA-like FMN-containing flavoprotein (pyridoxamine 5'-phosphate oxidase superfamily)